MVDPNSALQWLRQYPEILPPLFQFASEEVQRGYIANNPYALRYASHPLQRTMVQEEPFLRVFANEEAFDENSVVAGREYVHPAERHPELLQFTSQPFQLTLIKRN